MMNERERLLSRLERLTHKYISAGEADPVEQRKIRAEILDIRRELAVAAEGAVPADLPLDWQVFFPHVFRDQKKRGFDVVIANPPYIRIQRQGRLGDVYRKAWSTLSFGNADLSYAFVELALRESPRRTAARSPSSQPNFRQHDSAERPNHALGGRQKVPARLRLWVDFDDAQVFPTAANYVALLFAERLPGGQPQAEFVYSTPADRSWVDQDDIAWLRPRGARISIRRGRSG